jgi:hypothetical protein
MVGERSYTMRYASQGAYLWANFNGDKYDVVFIDANWVTKAWEGTDAKEGRQKWFEWGNPIGVHFVEE